ncbi:MAG: transposase [Bacteroidetes bacterium]|nr:transposase [Bacteroidota bacterium]
MKNQRRKFTDEFKKQVVKQAVQDRIPISRLALKFEITAQQIRTWTKAMQAETSTAKSH